MKFIGNILCLVLGVLIMALDAQAKPVTQQQAMDKARTFINGNAGGNMSGRWRAPRSNAQLKLASVRHWQQGTAQTADPCLYVFNVDGGGYVVVSADDRTLPVLGYSTGGAFSEKGIPENMEAWLQEYARQIAWIMQHDTPEGDIVGSNRAPASRAPVSPLLTTTWNQGDPYNSLCPQYNGNRCVTGCVATAMAQVLNYHRYPERMTQPIQGYQSNTSIYVSRVDNTTIDWDNMLPAYNGSENTAQKYAVARLMLMCGASVGMNYGTGTSSASSQYVPMALKTYFDFDATTQLARRNSYSYDEWVDLVYGEVKAGRPVIYSGQSAGGGHSFVIDGYAANDYFHVNWGWGGDCDEFFLLSILNAGSNSGIGASTSTDGYSFGQDAVINAKPNAGGVAAPYAMTSTAVRIEQTTYTRSSTDSYFSDVTLTCDMFNYNDETVTFDIGLGVFDGAGEMVAKRHYYTDVVLGPQYGFFYPDYPLTMAISFGSGLADGTYTIGAISKEKRCDEWLPNHYFERYAVKAIISGNTLTLQAPVVSLTGTMTAKANAEVGKDLPITATITNNGDDFNGDLMLYNGNTLVGGRHFEAAAGQTATLDLSYRPQQTGQMTLHLTYDGAVIASLNVNVQAAKAYDMSGTLDVTDYKGCLKMHGTLTNNSAYGYDNLVSCYLYKVKEGNMGYYEAEDTREMKIAAGATVTMDYQFDNLEAGGRYFCYLYYYSEGNRIGAAITYTYTIEPEEQPQVTVALAADAKIPNMWFAMGTNSQGSNAVSISCAIPGQSGSNINSWQGNVYNTFKYGQPQLTVSNADANEVKPVLCFRSMGNYVASDDASVLRYKTGGQTVNIATVNPSTGTFALENNANVRQLISNCSSTELKDALALPLCIKAEYNGERLNVENGDFYVLLRRPLTAEGNTLQKEESQDGSLTLTMVELVSLTDWIGNSFSAGGSTNLYNFYDVQSVTVTGATGSSNVGNYITTNLTGSFKPVSQVTSKIAFNYQPASRLGNTPTYGTLTIENNMATVADYALRIPLTVTYPWGTVSATAQVNISRAAPLEPVLVLTRLEVYGDSIVGTQHVIDWEVRNDGPTFNGNFYIFVQGKNDAEPNVKNYPVNGFPSGQCMTPDNPLHIVFNDPDTYRIWASLDADGKSALGETTIDIAPAATLTAKSYTREYGDENPVFEFEADNGGWSGEPVITCAATATSPVGTYPIVITIGTVDNKYVTLRNGTLTITKAPLTVTADDKEKRQGEANPAFTFSYKGFKAGDNENKLSLKPKATTTATANSAMGKYEIKVSDVAASNYQMSYVSGWLTVIGRLGDVNSDGTVNITDVVDVVQYVKGKTNGITLLAADVNDDRQVTVADAAATVNILLDYSYARKDNENDNRNELALRWADEGRAEVLLTGTTHFVACQFDINVDVDVDIKNHVASVTPMDGNIWRVIAYSPSNQPFDCAGGVLAGLTLNDYTGGEVTVSNVHFADSKAVDHQLPDVTLAATTGINDIVRDAPFNVYDINGRLLMQGITSTKRLPKGVYIINNKKVVIK